MQDTYKQVTERTWTRTEVYGSNHPPVPKDYVDSGLFRPPVVYEWYLSPLDGAAIQVTVNSVYGRSPSIILHAAPKPVIRNIQFEVVKKDDVPHAGEFGYDPSTDTLVMGRFVFDTFPEVLQIIKK